MAAPDPKMAVVGTKGWLWSAASVPPLLSSRVELEAAREKAKQPWSMSGRREEASGGG